MNQLEKDIASLITREAYLLFEEGLCQIDGRACLVGYPTPGHCWYTRTACFVWWVMDDILPRLSPWVEYQDMPSISKLTVKEITLEEVEEALQIMEGL